MRTLVYLLFVCLGLFSCNLSVKEQPRAVEDSVEVTQPRDGMFIHITAGYDDAHRVLMPMKMATLMANDKDVLVYMDIDAVELLVKDAADLEHDGFDSFQSYLKQLVELQVGVYACPTCLQVAGFSPDDLMEGVQLANKDRFFDFTKGRIITLDY